MRILLATAFEKSMCMLLAVIYNLCYYAVYYFVKCVNACHLIRLKDTTLIPYKYPKCVL